MGSGEVRREQSEKARAGILGNQHLAEQQEVGAKGLPGHLAGSSRGLWYQVSYVAMEISAPPPAASTRRRGTAAANIRAALAALRMFSPRCEPESPGGS